MNLINLKATVVGKQGFFIIADISVQGQIPFTGFIFVVVIILRRNFRNSWMVQNDWLWISGLQTLVLIETGSLLFPNEIGHNFFQ